MMKISAPTRSFNLEVRTALKGPLSGSTIGLFIFCVFLLLVSWVDSVWSVTKTKDIVYGTPREDKALVYLIRPAEVGGRALKLYMYVDETPVAVLPHATYSFVYVEPGRALLWGSAIAFQQEFEFIAGAEQYVELYNMRTVNRSEGRSLIEGRLKYAKVDGKDKKKFAKYLKRHGKAKDLRKLTEAGILPVEELPQLQAPADTSGRLRLPAYTEITAALKENVTSAFSEKGSFIEFEVTDDVNVAGKAVLSSGSTFQGKIIWTRMGGSGGMSGALSIAAPFVTANDGTKIPLTGNIYVSGEDKIANASSGAVFIGPLGAAMVKGREAFLVIGQKLTVFTRDTAWLIPGIGPALSEGRLGELASIDRELPAVTEKDIKLTLDTRKKPPQVRVSVLVRKQPRGVSIEAIHDEVLDPPLKPVKSERHGDGWTYSFDSWGIVRHVILAGDTEALIVPIVLTGKFDDGRRFRSDTTINFDLHVKSSDEETMMKYQSGKHF